MGTIEAFGTQVVSSSTDLPVQVNWSTWQTMSDADKVGKHWIITGAPDVNASATGIPYNNSGTGLVATNVQNAITEVAEKASHGIVELWKNAYISQGFTAQTINIANFDSSKYDAIIIAWEPAAGETSGTNWSEFDRDILDISGFSAYLLYTTIRSGGGTVRQMRRQLTVSLTGTVLSITFTGGTIHDINTYGSAATQTSDNSICIPVRILGLMHNSSY